MTIRYFFVAIALLWLHSTAVYADSSSTGGGGSGPPTGTTGHTVGFLDGNKTDSGSNVALGINSVPPCPLTAAATITINASTCPTSTKGVQLFTVTLTQATTFAFPTNLPVTDGDIIGIRINHGTSGFTATFSGSGWNFPSASMTGNQPTLSTGVSSIDYIWCTSFASAAELDCGTMLNMVSIGNYTGPGDVVASASAWWGLRAYSAAVAATGTQKAINIIRASNGAATDINILTTGRLDVATASTFCAATTCTVATFYDQSGHGLDITQATVGSQPVLTFNCIGAYPCLKGGELLSATITAIPQPLTMSVVTEQTVSSGGGQIFGGFGQAQVGFNLGGAPNIMFAYAGISVSETANDIVWHAMQAAMSDAASASAINLDGAEFTQISVGTGSSYTQLSLLGSGLQLTEAGIWASAVNSTNRASMNTNQHNFYNF